MIYEVTINGKVFSIELTRSNGGWRCKAGNREVSLNVTALSPDAISLIYDGQAYEARRDFLVSTARIWVNGDFYSAEVGDPRSFRGRRKTAGQEAGPRKLFAPMPGKVVRVLLADESEVEAGQGIMVIEAMKMQNEVKSPKKGRIQKIAAQAGTSVNAGDLLAIVE